MRQSWGEVWSWSLKSWVLLLSLNHSLLQLLLGNKCIAIAALGPFTPIVNWFVWAWFGPNQNSGAFGHALKKVIIESTATKTKSQAYFFHLRCLLTEGLNGCDCDNYGSLWTNHFAPKATRAFTPLLFQASWVYYLRCGPLMFKHDNLYHSARILQLSYYRSCLNNVAPIQRHCSKKYRYPK